MGADLDWEVTHGPTYLGLYDVATGKRTAQVMELDDAPKPKWTQGTPLLYCCTVKTANQGGTK